MASLEPSWWMAEVSILVSLEPSRDDGGISRKNKKEKKSIPWLGVISRPGSDRMRPLQLRRRCAIYTRPCVFAFPSNHHSEWLDGQALP